MDSKKQYYYNYNQAVPQNSPPTPPDTQVTTDTQDILQGQITPSSPPTTSPTFDNNATEVKKSNIIPVIFISIALIIIGFLVWTILPKNYQDCLKFPGSTSTLTPTVTCRTFYGTTFENETTPTPPSATTPLPPLVPITPAPEALTTNPQPIPIAPDTTKGGQALPTPTQTPQPTTSPQPTSTPPQNQTGGASQVFNPPIDWTRHTYPTQKFTIFMPKAYHPSSALQNQTTRITTITVTKDGHPYNPAITLRLQPNWGEYESVKNQSVTFMIADTTGVIKVDSDQNFTRYFFVRNNQVWVYTCNHQGNDTVKAECDNILKSIQFN